MTLDNASIAILSAVNELATSHGLNPCAFVATVSFAPEGRTVLSYESPPPDEQSRSEFFRMLSTLGLSEHNLSFGGDEQSIYSALMEAIRLAPRRFRR